MATPQIPPRPTRAQNSQAGSTTNMDLPKIPPRPAKRSIERSVSPNRDTFARSPLNDPAFLHNQQHHARETHLNTEVPARPPSVSLPSIGQEGSEYASLEDLRKTLSKDEPSGSSPQQTKAIAGDLPLHAPKAALPSSTAKRQIQGVTRTDSNQAAVAGIGKLAPEDKSTHGPDSTRSGSSIDNRSRPASMYKDDEEQGIPEIGIQVPMYPNAGDVQAPTPGPADQGPATGVGFFNKGGQSAGRHHSRTKSGREIFHGPPGSYGMHGHGVIPNDDFEKKWYEKHPEDLKREKAGEYGPHIQVNRKDYHWVGDDLHKLVHSTSSQGIGLGTSRESIGTPDEQIGYIASEEFASRLASPRPQSGRPASIKSGITAESPLRQSNFPVDQLTKTKTNETDEEDVIHIEPPAHHHSKYSGGGYDPPTEDLGPEGGNTEEEGGFVTERGYGMPILASDEIKKHPEAEWRQPAVSPELERRRSGEFTLNDPEGQPAYITKQKSHSRSSSRNNSIHSMNKLHRFATPTEHERSGTPLESHKEYEPLFPEDEDHKQKPKSVAEKFKRPELARHHFPSQDVWEDTPSSLQLETTVETPEVPEQKETSSDANAGEVFETPESETARKENITEEDQQSFLPEHTRRFANKHLQKEHLSHSARPGMQQRFPSHDIWEDAPDHGQLVTTVSTPQIDDTSEYAEDNPGTDKPSVPTRPSVPSRLKPRDTSPVEKSAVPIVPDRPKPQIPARPSKPLTKSSEQVPTLDSQPTEAPQPKAKPQVPARPGGSKIAALQAGFLKDLNSKLGLGPQAPKIKEPEEEKEQEAPKPLQDARKGRAKGPQRRKPTSSPSPATATTVTSEVAVPRPKFETSSVTTVWSIGDDGSVDVPAARMAEKIQAALNPDAVGQTTESVVSATKAEEPVVDVAKDIPGGYLPEPEENQLTKMASKESIKSALLETDAEQDAEPEVDAQGGVYLENKVSVDAPSEPLSAIEPKSTEDELPPTLEPKAAADAPEQKTRQEVAAASEV